MNIPLPSQKMPAHWLRSFVEYLVERKVLNSGAVSRLIKFRAQIDMRIGQLAAIKGYITAKDIVYVIASQADGVEGLFGELAVQNGFMSNNQVEDVIRIQGDPLRLFLETLLLTKMLEEDSLKRIVKDFLESSRIAYRSTDEAAKEDAAEVETHILPHKGAKRDIRGTLRTIKGVASLPAVVQRVLNLLGDPEVEIESIAEALQLDQALCAHLLRMVNSAFFGLRGKVGSIRQAVVTVGIKGVRQSVFASQVFERIKSGGNEKAKDILRHTVYTVVWARALAKARGMRDTEDVSMAALMHDLGKSVILQYFPFAAEGIERLFRKGHTLEEAEQVELGLTHADIGAFLCHHWTLPPALCQAVLYHHAVTEVLRLVSAKYSLTGLVNASCRLAGLCPLPLTWDGVAGLEDDFFEYHRLTPETLRELAPQVRQSAEELAVTLA